MKLLSILSPLRNNDTIQPHISKDKFVSVHQFNNTNTIIKVDKNELIGHIKEDSPGKPFVGSTLFGKSITGLSSNGDKCHKCGGFGVDQKVEVNRFNNIKLCYTCSKKVEQDIIEQFLEVTPETTITHLI